MTAKKSHHFVLSLTFHWVCVELDAFPGRDIDTVSLAWYRAAVAVHFDLESVRRFN